MLEAALLVEQIAAMSCLSEHCPPGCLLSTQPWLGTRLNLLHASLIVPADEKPASALLAMQIKPEEIDILLKGAGALDISSVRKKPKVSLSPVTAPTCASIWPGCLRMA